MCWLTSTNCSRNKIRVIDNLNVFNEMGNDICQLIVNHLYDQETFLFVCVMPNFINIFRTPYRDNLMCSR
jgi:hypothetical protein